MPNNHDKIRRVEFLIEKAKELIQMNHTESFVMDCLKDYHRKTFTTSHITREDDLDMVRSRVFD